MKQLIHELGYELQLKRVENETEDGYLERIRAYAKEHPEEAQQAVERVSKRKPLYSLTEKEKEEVQHSFFHMLVKVVFGVLRV